MAKAAIAARKLAAERGIALGGALDAHLAAAERDAKMAPALRKLSHLSAERTADELARLGFGTMSYMTIRRARQRLGLPDWRDVARGKAVAAAKPRRRRAAKKAKQQVAAE